MAALLRVKWAKGCSSAPAVGQISWVRMGEGDGRGAEVESGARKDRGKVSSKLFTVPVEEGSNVVMIIREKFRCPSCETTCGNWGK